VVQEMQKYPWLAEEALGTEEGLWPMELINNNSSDNNNGDNDDDCLIIIINFGKCLYESTFKLDLSRSIPLCVIKYQILNIRYRVVLQKKKEMKNCCVLTAYILYLIYKSTLEPM
jgi:hypothetical protein